MTRAQDRLLTAVTVRLRDQQQGNTIGTGVVYAVEHLEDRIYIITAAHCLHEDKDQFRQARSKVLIDIYRAADNSYQTLEHEIDFDLVAPDVDRDLAILVLSKQLVNSMIGEIPYVQAINERRSATSFMAKGFPSATAGEELTSITPTWIQDVPTLNKFQLHLSQDFSTPESARSQVDGFSGSGIFLVNHGQLYFLGIFSRFLEAGKVIYCQYLDSLNDLLDHAFLPPIEFAFVGEHGLSSTYFKAHIEKAIRNLGPRFSEELNLRLPVALRFSDLAKDKKFKLRIFAILDKYMTTRHYYSSRHPKFEEVEIRYQKLDGQIRKWFSQLDWSPEGKIQFEDIENSLSEFDEAAQQAIMDFYELRSQVKAAEQGTRKKYEPNEPFQTEISGLRQMQQTNSKLQNELDEIDLQLSNHPILIIKGEAGSGKSHLLGDVAKFRQQQGLPTLLLLGQLFKPGQTIWQNILAQLELNCTKTELLDTLTHIGTQVGSRVLVLVDALNEGAGKDLWYHELAGFIHELKNYPFIGVAMTVRSTYWNVIIPPAVSNDKQIPIINHEGFRGNEYAALKLFCEHYGIRQPNFPILAPEYSSPLFLQLICKSIQNTPEKTFPQGFQGLSKIFQYYLKSLNETFSRKRSEYSMRPKLLKDALELLAIKSFERENYKHLSLEETHELLHQQFPLFPHLLEDLVEESVLMRSMIKSYGVEEEYEVVFFAFQRFGEYHVALQLLSKYASPEEVLAAGAKGNLLGELASEIHWAYHGLLEALAVLLPEQFGLEITEVYPWVFEQRKERRDNLYDWINQWLVDSLKWRELASIDSDKIIKWIKESGHFEMDLDNWYYFVLEVTAVKGHPFNSDRLHKILSYHSMAKRDSFWQQHMEGYHGLNDQNVAFPITRLIEWAWQDDISITTDQETARLVGQTLCWVLSSTNHGLRDQATKALVNLLQDQPGALNQLMTTFADIDDMYILERLYAVAYGCALRSLDNTALATLARNTYQQIFADGPPPEHLLLRDHARNIVEYAHHLNLVPELNIQNVRPPYQSKLPKRFPTEAEIKKYDPDPEDDNYDQYHAKSSSKIHFSVMSWDFSRYVIDSALDHLVPIRFTLQSEIQGFKKGLKRDGKSAFDTLKKFYEIVHTSEDFKKNFFKYLGPEKAKETWDAYEQYYQQFKEKLYALLDEPQKEFLEQSIFPYWDQLLKSKEETDRLLNTTLMKCWIVQRVFELGYDHELHGAYDQIHDDYTDHRTDSRVDRIGKKYQWIAFFQLLSVLTDNHKYKESWAYDREGKHYQGPWEFMLRDVDPSFLLRADREKYPEKDFGLSDPIKLWWAMDKYGYWNRLPEDWASSMADLPEVRKCIQKTDNSGGEWLHLNLSYTWKQPKQVGEDSYRTDRREIWYMCQAYLIKKGDKQKAIIKLRENNFHGRRFPEDYTISNLLAREQFWSPISKQSKKGSQQWIQFEEAGCKVALATNYAVGELSEDKSGAHFQHQMPCKMIKDGMRLHYSRRDGDFVDSTGETIMINDSLNGVLIKKTAFMEYLKQNKLEVIWVFLGEKNSFSKEDRKRGFRKSLSGIYYLQEDELVGDMHMTDW
jgi:hypothetical protein